MVYQVRTPPRTKTVHPVCVYILKVYPSFFSYFSFLFFLSRYNRGDIWVEIYNGTKTSSGCRRSPKRIEPNTRPNRGLANTAGSDRPTWFAWSTTGADCAPPRLLPDNNPHAGGPV
jgi:hypothetical protein